MKRKIDYSDIGAQLHTALRKYTDSKAGIIAQHAINLMPLEAWAFFLNHLITEKVSTPEELKAACLKWDYFHRPSELDFSHHSSSHFTSASIILHSAFELFDENDWHGFGYILFEDEGQEKERKVDQVQVEYVLRNAHPKMGHKYKGRPLWAFVMDLCAVGKTTAHEICLELGWNPDQDGLKQLPR